MSFSGLPQRSPKTLSIGLSRFPKFNVLDFLSGKNEDEARHANAATLQMRVSKV